MRWPIAVERVPLAVEYLPIAVEKSPLAFVSNPVATDLSPMFASPRKGEPLGVARFRTLRASVPSMHVLALGGIDASNAAIAREAGADGVAVIRAVLAAPDPEDAVRRLLG